VGTPCSGHRLMEVVMGAMSPRQGTVPFLALTP